MYSIFCRFAIVVARWPLVREGPETDPLIISLWACDLTVNRPSSGMSATKTWCTISVHMTLDNKIARLLTSWYSSTTGKLVLHSRKIVLAHSAKQYKYVFSCAFQNNNSSIATNKQIFPGINFCFSAILRKSLFENMKNIIFPNESKKICNNAIWYQILK